MKKSGWLYFFFMLIVTGSWFYSCVKDPYQDQVNQEKKQLAEYVSKHKITETPKPSGLYVIINPKDTGTGANPLSTDYVLINYNAFLLDSTLYDSTDTTEVKKLNGHIPWFKPGGPVILSMSSVVFPGIMEGLSLLREGGSATLLMPSALAGNSFNPTPRIFHVKLLKVFDNVAASQKLPLDSIMQGIGFTLGDSATTTYIDTSQIRGLGHFRLPSDNDTVAVKYTLRYIDGYNESGVFGRVCESKDVFKFPMDTTVKPPYYDVLKEMTTNGIAKIYFISGSGPYYDNNTGQLLVYPFSNVWYDVELLGFVHKNGIIDKTQ